MRVFALLTALILATGSLFGQQATFKAGTSIVPVLTTVTDTQGRLVPNLEQDEFTVRSEILRWDGTCSDPERERLNGCDLH